MTDATPAVEARDRPDASVVLITNITSPYRYAFWEAVARRTGSLLVLLCAESEENRIWRTDEEAERRFVSEVLPGRSLFLRRSGATLHWNPSILGRLRRAAPTHLIVAGYHSPTHLSALLWARLRRVPCVMWTGSHRASFARQGAAARALRRGLLSLPHAFFTYGSSTTRTLVGDGIPESRIATGTNCVDVEAWARSVDGHAQPGGRDDDRIRFLYVGQLIERKGIRELLRAFERLPADRAVLSIVGYGELEDELREQAGRSGGGNVVFEGATRTPEETARHAARSDVLVMPSSREVWGLVVNEGLAAGLYVVASASAGATPDLIERAPVRCGTSFDPARPDDLVEALRRALEEAPDADRDAIRAWGRSHTPERYADAALTALALAERAVR